MPPDETARATLGLSALAGGVVWGLYHLSTTLLAGQTPHRQEILLAMLNVAIGILIGVLVAYFVGPVLGPMIPVAGLRDAHAVGFGIGALSWEAAPFVLRWFKAVADKKAGGAS